MCTTCGKNCLRQHTFYRCDQCDFNQCRPCMYKTQGLIEDRWNFAIHPCSMNIHNESSHYYRRRWMCDLTTPRMKDISNHSSKLLCRSGCLRDSNTSYVNLQNYLCRRCDFDLCFDCCIFWRSRDLNNISKVDKETQYFLVWYTPAYEARDGQD